MKVKARIQKTESVEIEITFPVYRYHDCGGDTYESEYFTRLDENLRAVMIHRGCDYRRDNRTADWALEVTQFKSIEEYVATGDLDWVLGLNDHALTEQRWLEVLAEFRKAVDSI